MVNFLYDNVALPATKTNIRVATPFSQAWNAADANSVFQALEDIRVEFNSRPLSVKAYGAVGNWNPTTQTGTDDTTAFRNTIAAAIAAKTHVVIPPGNYRLTDYVCIQAAKGLCIKASAFASIYYSSDSLTLKEDATALSLAQRRSAFLVKDSQDIIFDGLEFVGGTSTELTYVNLGCGIYATASQGIRVKDCTQRYGNALFVQDAQTNTGATSGNTLTVSGGLCTLTNDGDVNYNFHQGMVGKMIAIVNATNNENNGIFEILTVNSSTSLVYANAAGITEATSPLVWAVADGDRDTRIVNCRSLNARGVSYTGVDSVYEGCLFERQMTPDITGIPNEFVLVSGTTWKMIDADGAFDASHIGKYVKIAGATTSANNGIFKILSVLPGNYITYTNTAGGATAEYADQNTTVWCIFDGEKTSVGATAGNAITTASGVVTFTSQEAIFTAQDVGKSIRLIDATNVNNRGSYIITRYISSTQIQYINSAAVTEAYLKPFTIDGYDSRKGDSAVGPVLNANSIPAATSSSVGSASLTDSGRSMVTNAYAGRYLTDSAGRQWLILSNTSTVFTLSGSGTPATGAYTVTAGSTHGSTHGIYLFGGRSNVTINNCTFKGVRTTAVKVSGSSAPIENITVSNCTAIECGAFFIGGADDSQEHNNINIHDNKLVNCAVGRVGWNDQWGIGLLGARNVNICYNQIIAKHDLIAALIDSGNVGSYYGIYAGQYVAGRSQALENLTCDHNTMSVAASCLPARVAAAAINVERVGLRAKYRTASGGFPVVITLSGSVATLEDPNAFFSQYDVGTALQLVNFTDGANNGSFTVTAVTGTTKISFVNGSAVVGSKTAGTYRMRTKSNNPARRGSTCSLSKNEISGYGVEGILTTACVGPEIKDNIFNAMAACISDTGSVGPRFEGNREVTTHYLSATNARIKITATTSWPFFDDNIITNGSLTGGNASLDGTVVAGRTEMGIGVGSSTPVDYPLCGKRGRCKSTAGKAEVVVGFGQEWVDGDSVDFSGTVCTYLTTSPNNGTGGTFSTMAGFYALIGSGFTAEEYGTGLAGTPTTGHIRIRLSALSSSADQGYCYRVNTLNPTAFVVLFNAVGGGEATAYTRGEAVAGDIKRFVVWSQACGMAGVMITATGDKTGVPAAAALLAGGYYNEKALTTGAPNGTDNGACDVIRTVNTHAGTEEIRWVIA